MSGPRRWLRSFRFAYEGLIYALSTERNMKFHFMTALIVLLLALFFKLSKLEILFIILAIILIVIAELFNTALEKAVDLAMPHQHPIAKIAKDVAAAAVLVTAVFAVAVGLIVFYEPVNALLTEARDQAKTVSVSVESLLIFVCLVTLIVIVIQTRFTKRRINWRPSIIAALAFSMATMMVLYATELIVGLLACALCALIVMVLFEKTDRSFASLLLGGVIGSVLTLFAYLFMQSL